jgi:acetyl esterase/lipase
MKTRGNVRRTVFLTVLSMLLAATPSWAGAADTRCDREAVRVASEVANDPPVQSPSSLYYDLAMREPHTPPADHRIFYGTSLLQFGDLRLPKGRGPFPVAIVIHGGGWSSSSATLGYMAPVAEALTCAGIATWNIEYRRVPGAGAWPGTFRDVAAAADFLRELAQRYPLDLSRVVATGHSAGGHLVLWLAARHRLPPDAELYTPNPLPLKGVVPLAGVPDLLKLAAVMPQYNATFLTLVGGGDPAQVAPRMKQVSPVELSPLGVPQIFIHGSVDPSVPPNLITEYAATATANGDDVQVIFIDNGFHFESVDPAHPHTGPAIRDSVRSLLGLPTGRSGR